MTWHATILTLFPEMFPGTLGQSIAGKALANQQWQLDTVNIRDYATDKHKSVDDTPYGGGAGMVLRPDIVSKAVDALPTDNRPRYYMSPRGTPLTQQKTQDLSRQDGIVMLCGRYEGLDQRILDYYQFEELSIGDYVLSGGELAAQVVLDSCIRLLPGVMGHAQSGVDESHSAGLLEYPQYTRPPMWNGHEVPKVLLSGNHAAIDAWRAEQAKALTAARRPDMWAAYTAKGTEQ